MSRQLFSARDLLAWQDTWYLLAWRQNLARAIGAARERDDLAGMRTLRRSLRQVAAELKRRETSTDDGI